MNIVTIFTVRLLLGIISFLGLMMAKPSFGDSTKDS